MNNPASPLAKDHTPPAVPQRRTWVVAVALVIAVAAGGAFSALIRYDLVGFGHLPRSAVFLAFVLLLLNAGWMRLAGRRLLDTAQLVFIFIAVMVMSGFPGQQLVTYLYIGLIGSQHYATAENKYIETFFKYVPHWLVPSLDPDSPAVRWAFYGTPGMHSLPWQAWVIPLLAWTPYLLALLMLGATAMALLRRRWADEEHLVFPLALISIEMLTYRSPREKLPRAFCTWPFWAAFLIPVFLYTKNGLHNYFPAIPATNLLPDLGMVFAGRPWNQLNYLPYYYYFEMMGITYLVSDEVGFSLWFFWLFRRFGAVFRDMAGATDHEHFFEHQGLGAYLVLAVLYLWSARHSLRQIGLKALWGQGDFDESQEPMSARLMLYGFVASLGVVVLWGSAIGAAWWWALLLMAFYLVTIIVVGRIVSEAGVFAVWTPFENLERVIVQALGPTLVGTQSITALSYMGYKIRDTASLSSANILQGYKLSELAQLNSHAVWRMIAVSLVVALFASHWPALHAIYSRTVPALGWWPKSSGNALGSGIMQLLDNSQRFTPGNYGNMALGAGSVLFLNFMRQRFLWWPFHPLSFTAMMGPGFAGDRYGFSILIGWVVRRVTHYFGGYYAYNTLRSAAVGIIVGNAVVLLIWTIINYFHPIGQVLITE